jgi:phage gp36-like protein
MIFLATTDFDTVLKGQLKAAIVTSNEETTNQAERYAIAQITSYLSGRFDTVNIFNKSGLSRPDIIVMYCVDMTLNHLYTQISPQNIPDYVSNRYKEAMDWLKMVANNQLNPDLPQLESEPTGTFRVGGETKVTRKW